MFLDLGVGETIEGRTTSNDVYFESTIALYWNCLALTEIYRLDFQPFPPNHPLARLQCYSRALLVSIGEFWVFRPLVRHGASLTLYDLSPALQLIENYSSGQSLCPSTALWPNLPWSSALPVMMRFDRGRFRLGTSKVFLFRIFDNFTFLIIGRVGRQKLFRQLRSCDRRYFFDS